VTEIDSRKYVLFWESVHGTAEYRIYAWQVGDSIPSIALIFEHRSAGIAITHYYYDIENQVFWYEPVYRSGDNELGRGGVNTSNLMANEEERQNLEIPSH